MDFFPQYFCFPLSFYVFYSLHSKLWFTRLPERSVESKKQKPYCSTEVIVLSKLNSLPYPSFNTNGFHTSSVPCLRSPVLLIPLPISKVSAPETEMDSPTSPGPVLSQEPPSSCPLPFLQHSAGFHMLLLLCPSAFPCFWTFFNLFDYSFLCLLLCGLL